MHCRIRRLEFGLLDSHAGAHKLSSCQFLFRYTSFDQIFHFSHEKETFGSSYLPYGVH